MINWYTIIFPHQLFADEYWKPMLGKGTRFLLVEEWLFFQEFKFHKQKLAFHRASMRAFYEHFKSLGRDIEYIEFHDERNDVRSLINSLSGGNCALHLFDPTDFWLEKRVSEASANSGVQVTWEENPQFLNTRDDLKGFFKPEKRSFFQTTFYKSQRLKFGVLLHTDGSPVGGKWSFDTENRQRYPRGSQPPKISKPSMDKYSLEAKEYVLHHFSMNPGNLDTFPLVPIDRKGALEWLDEFLLHRLNDFGTYEDAVVSNQSFLHHSLLSPLMNAGLLTTNEIGSRTLEFSKNRAVPLNSLEGFVRQIMGWREFIRGMYQVRSVPMRTTNYWGFTRKIPPSFYDGTTGITPVDDTIKKVLKTGYCHHIERLMVLGNFMLLCEFDPDEVYRWFMELFIDAYDWVMVPNVYGMSQFADGGLFATKPYISGSNYLKKMSDYKGDATEWDLIWDGLFWSFMDKQRHFFETNPRLSMLIRSWDKMDNTKKEAHLKRAAAFHALLDASVN